MVSEDKKSLSEREIQDSYITPAILAAEWPESLVYEEFPLTAGRIIVRGETSARAAPKRADYVLFHKTNVPLAIVEAKDNKHSLGSGMGQALKYAEMFDVPFAFSSNGDGFLFHDNTVAPGEPVESTFSLSQFPRPDDLWGKYCGWKGIDPAAALVEQEFYVDDPEKVARYYQSVAVKRVVEGVERGKRRLLLVMATGTGKTFTAFQIMWRLWRAGRAKRILFLVDRNVLADQALVNDFRPFGSVMTKIVNRNVDKSYEIYLALYQAITGTHDESNIYRQFSPEFFDCVVIDECHRGSAAEDSAWRDVLDYFTSAIQIGMTATPRETVEISTSHYFGEPEYSYSLRQGIDDGFLAPYKVVKVDLDKDRTGWRPENGQRDRHGRLIPDRRYGQGDYDRSLVLEERTNAVAEHLSDYLRSHDRQAKTIVFCVDIDHAERMRQALVNANSDITTHDARYVVRITGDSYDGRADLDDFIDPSSPRPAIATTSKLLSTGVDAQTVKVIVLDQRIQSMTEFKQMIGRGTRIREDYGKTFFTIIDFRNATALFADPDFDGEPEVVYEPGEPPAPDADDEPGDPPDTDQHGRQKYYVDRVPVWVVGEQVQYYSASGMLVTESLRDYTRTTVQHSYQTLDLFLSRWNASQRKAAVLRELEDQGLLLSALVDEFGDEYDPFDLVCHVAYGRSARTRRDRADRVRRSRFLTEYGDQARAVLSALLDKYADEGIDGIEDVGVLRLRPVSALGTPMELLSTFGGRDEFESALIRLEDYLYQEDEGA